jgi:hypothetical protein
MSMQNLKPVSKEEFDAFLASYPRKLVRDVARMFDPELITFNDFSDGKAWPDSVVACYTEGGNSARPWCS